MSNSNIKIIRLITGEDVICKSEIQGDHLFMRSPFVIVPTQSAPGKPVQLMMTPYAPYSDEDKIGVSMDKVVTMTKPKADILGSYQQNTSKILQPKPELITESTLPTFDSTK